MCPRIQSSSPPVLDESAIVYGDYIIQISSHRNFSNPKSTPGATTGSYSFTKSILSSNDIIRSCSVHHDSPFCIATHAMSPQQGNEGSTDSSSLVSDVETVLCPKTAKKGRNWHRGIVDAVDRFMTRWQTREAEMSGLRHRAKDA